MSIWSSIDRGDDEVHALENANETTNYRGEGEPDVLADVATTGHHDLISLRAFSMHASGAIDSRGIDFDILLTPDDAARLAGWLEQAARRVKTRVSRPDGSWDYEPLRDEDVVEND